MRVMAERYVVSLLYSALLLLVMVGGSNMHIGANFSRVREGWLSNYPAKEDVPNVPSSKNNFGTRFMIFYPAISTCFIRVPVVPKVPCKNDNTGFNS